MYSYEKERDHVFTDSGQRQLLRIRDRVREAFESNGCITVGAAIADESGCSWGMLACVDGLRELGEIRIIEIPGRMTQLHVIVPERV